MNKTININLANTFFHIDEDAYAKLQRYLEAIRRSFTDSEGRDEIIADIEARIAELFTERQQHDRQVISTKEVDEVITIMGQPEDYLVDEEIFDDAPKAKARTRGTHKEQKKLYRDTDNKYISGVSSGLGHYLGIDTIWIRLLWILLTFASGFTFIFVYVLFWVLVPEAKTTAEKLAMTGEEVNISNIEKKIKEGFDNVADKVKNVDYEKVGTKVKSSTDTFFDAIGNVFMFIFKIFAKLIGILLLIISASTLIGLFIGLFTAGTIDMFGMGQPWMEFVQASVEAPIWLISAMMFFAVGIPFFFLFYLGLKILVSNVKSIGSIAKFTLLGLWIISIIGLTIFGLKTASVHTVTGSETINEALFTDPTDTLVVEMVVAENIDNRYYRNSDFDIIRDGSERKIYSEDVHFQVRSTTDSVATIKVIKESHGMNYDDANRNATAIEYDYSISGNTLKLNNFLTTDYANKFRDQEVNIVIYIPEGSTIYFDKTTKRGISRMYNNDQGFHSGYAISEHYWRMNDDTLECLDCEENDDVKEEEKDTVINKIKIDAKGIDINVKDKSGDSFKMKVDESGVQIKSN
ncbi:PspC domain-containing protein [Zhouia amylolytica]|uniref:Putative stress-responsive transcriptional regulator n=1 Tax=Zhouia amylolytica AD3 TaxID=1286632 RepID=W2URD8_9FLAO|nr:PspC domain-containing protein [Zhouia amylolytica]ETN96509.1 putative stress-responsive transcriptional regulator [Zhouia amylolytica AD3]